MPPSCCVIPLVAPVPLNTNTPTSVEKPRAAIKPQTKSPAGAEADHLYGNIPTAKQGLEAVFVCVCFFFFSEAAFKLVFLFCKKLCGQ
jgi:hypothetical protein